MEPAERAKLHSTSGGASETELKELAVRPMKLPCASRAVTMVTPVANMPSASRNSEVEKLGGRALGGVTVESMGPIYPNSMTFCRARSKKPRP